MHRDYSHYSGSVAIVIFDDRIEIQSYGRLPNGVTVEQLSGPHLSRPTNPLIAEAFHRTGAVEIWGRGTNRVIEMCEKHGATQPVFEERQGFVVVTFKAEIGTETGKAWGVPKGHTRGQTRGQTRGKTRGQTRVGTRERILGAIQTNPKITMREIARMVGLTEKGVEWNLRLMKKARILKRVGPNKGGHWEVLE